jgi:transcription termination factor Rho
MLRSVTDDVLKDCETLVELIGRDTPEEIEDGTEPVRAEVVSSVDDLES